MKKILYLILAFAFAFSLAACGSSENDKGKVTAETPPSELSETKPEELEDPAGEDTASIEDLPPVPDFELTSMDGETYALSDFSGKIVVLNFWASWCPPCKAEMPDFQQLHDDFSEDDIVILMLNQTFGRETQEDADKYIEENEFTFNVLYDPGEVGYSIFGVQSYPTTVVINAEGYLSGYVVGMTDYDTVLKLIEEAKGDA